MSQYKKELKIAIDLVKKATEITEWFKKRGFKSYYKHDQSPVTLADFASQIFIISKLKDYFPDDEIIAEEENVNLIDKQAENLIKECFNNLNLDILTFIRENIGYRGKSAERQWTIDPIDGTIGFQEGLSYAVGVGFMLNSIPKVCAIAVPNYNQKSLAIFSAEEGQGARALYGSGDFLPINVSQEEDFNNVKLCHSLHYDKPWVRQVAKILGINNLIQIDSMAKFCMIADGSADLYLKPLEIERSFTWDFMPGDLIVRGAGGKVSDLNGEPIKFKNNYCLWTAPGIIASNRILQDKVVNLIKSKNLKFS